ncbi:MAG TPA: helix-turn-helix transcriptional regulator, partial [Polyangiaceae bacterium]|nr:helix-turn-helix transcriptional regulator [Polyangiaceae bacterium]
MLAHSCYHSAGRFDLTLDPTAMARPLRVLLFEARMRLSVGSQGALGTLLGSSVRSGQRWERGEAMPMPEQVAQLASMVFPKDA